MNNRLIMFIILSLLAVRMNAQDIWMTRSGKISFHAGTSLEDIDGVNTEVASLFNTKTGELAFQVPVKSFQFTRSLMEEHFNENYMESTKFPKSTFNGKITDISKLNFSKDGSYPVTVEGDLNIHGVTRKVSAPGNLKIEGGKISASSQFKVALADYNITIPGVVAEKLAKEAVVEVSCRYEKKN